MTYNISTPVTEENTALLKKILTWLPGTVKMQVETHDDTEQYTIIDTQDNDVARPVPLDFTTEEGQRTLLRNVPQMYKVTNPAVVLATLQTSERYEVFLNHPDALLTKVIPQDQPDTYYCMSVSCRREPVRISSDYLEPISTLELLEYSAHAIFTAGHGTYISMVAYHNPTNKYVGRSVYGTLRAPAYLHRDSNGKYNKITTADMHLFSSYLSEQIRVRYAFFDRPKSGLSNVVMDSFFPRLMFRYNGDKKQIQENSDIPSTAVAISPFVAEYLNVKKVPTDQLLRVLGYTLKDIKQLLTEVKRKKLNFVFLGAGGTGMNTAYWLSELTKLTSTYKIFSKVAVFEKESVEYSNMLRFPLDSSAYNIPRGNLNKIQLITPLLKNLGSRTLEIHEQYLPAKKYISSEIVKRHPTEHVVDNTVLYGAPGIEYRDELAKIGPLICATHANTSCSIWLNPKQNMDLQIETYGIIQLGSFFMNQLQMTIELLKLLASDQDLHEADKHIMDFEFDGTLKLRPDRNYHWQLDHNNLVMTTTEANNF